MPGDPGCSTIAEALHANGTPCAWLDDLPADASCAWPKRCPRPSKRCWRVRPGRGQRPDSCWQALSQLDVERAWMAVLSSAVIRYCCKPGSMPAAGPSAWRPAGHCAATPWPTGELPGRERSGTPARRGHAAALSSGRALGGRSSGRNRASLDDIGVRRSKGEKP